MTTWYQGHGVHDRTPWHPLAPIMAFSVRPDLWPPGTYCWTVGPEDMVLADWAVQPGRRRPDTQYEAPGAAEALILADLVFRGPSPGIPRNWVEVDL